MRIVFLVLLLLLQVAGPARAQWGTKSDARTGLHAAMLCPVNRIAQGGPGLCLRLACAQGGPAGFELAAVKMPALAGAAKIELFTTVDNHVGGTITFAATRRPGIYRAAMNRQDFEMLGRMRRGRLAEFSVSRPDRRGQLRYRAGLDGADGAIGSVLQSCRLPDFAAQERAARIKADPIRAVTAQLQADCAEAGGVLRRDGVFARRMDLDGSGRGRDLLLDWGEMQCSAMSSGWCGSAGCVLQVWKALPDGRYINLWDGNAYSIKVIAPNTLDIALHGSACGRVGVDGCLKTFRIVGDDLKLIGAR